MAKSGGMIQLQHRDGTWTNCFPVSYKPQSAAMNVARKYRTSTRIVNRKGEVIFTCGWVEKTRG
jgi:hypothetical protein